MKGEVKDIKLTNKGEERRAKAQTGTIPIDKLKDMIKDYSGEAMDKDIPDKNRSANFKTVMAYVDDSVELTCEGIVKGTITRRIKGVGGFGYDSIFYSNEKNKTFAEMSIQEKNLVSHRSKAIIALRAKLATYFNIPNKKENA